MISGPALEVDIPVRWSPKQWRGIAFRPPRTPDGRPPIEQVGFLGEYGSGKTCGAGGRFAAVALENPFEPGVHSEGDHPLSGLVSPTMASMYSSTLPQLRRSLRPELILRERLYPPHQDILLVTGHLIKLYTAEGAIEGPSLCQLWVDECQLRVYDSQWVNLLKRVRDVRARRLNFQVSGLANYGPIEEQWRHPRPPNQLTVIFRTSDNVSNLAAGYVDARLGAMTASDLDRDEDGWVSPKETLYPHFGPANLARAPALAERLDRVTHLGVDLRAKSAVVFVQEEPVRVELSDGGSREEAGLLAVDQMIQEHQSAETIVDRIRRDKRWRIESGRSVIAMDPTASMDEVNWFKKGFPGCRVVQAKTGPYFRAENGQRAVERAVRDGAGNVRLFVHPSLVGKSKRGIVEMFRGYSERKLKDGELEHVADALRYIVQARLPLPEMGLVGNVQVDPNANTRSAWQPA